MSSETLTASAALKHELTVVTDASVGVIAIRCPETEVYRVVDEIYSLAMASPSQKFRMHTSEQGWAEFPRIDFTADAASQVEFDPLNPTSFNKNTADVGKAFEAIYAEGENMSKGLNEPGDTTSFLVMIDLYQSFGEPRTHTRIRKQVQRSLDVDQRLFLVVPNSAEIPDEIAPLMHVIEYGYPTRAELQQSLIDLLEDNIEDEDKIELTDDEIAMIVSNGQGMTSTSFDTAISLAITQYVAENEVLEGFGAEHISASLRKYKVEMLRKTDVLELQEQVPSDQIGGLDLFKQWMLQRRATYTEIAADKGVMPSRGCLVVGPPGTGKSLVAKAAGSILNLPVIRFDVGRVFGAYVGQSEGTMRKVLAMIDAMAPCVLMVDEIDKGFAGMSGGQNDNGTASRVFGTFLTWMQERDQVNRPVFTLFTANRVHGLPPELTRKGRIDETWAVSVPNDDERFAIARIHAEKRGKELDDDTLARFVHDTDGFVGSEIEAAIADALVISLTDENEEFGTEHLAEALEYVKPMSQTRKEDFDAMRTWAETNARAASSPFDAEQSIVSKTRSKRPKAKRVKAKVSRPRS